MTSFTRQEALDYHRRGRPGKIQIAPTKPQLSFTMMPADSSGKTGALRMDQLGRAGRKSSNANFLQEGGVDIEIATCVNRKPLHFQQARR